jgi:hypothetical protein
MTETVNPNLETPMVDAENTIPVNRVQRSWGHVSDCALRETIVITTKWRPRHVLMAFDEYERLKARDRRAYRIEGLPDDLAALLETGLDDLSGPNLTVEDGDNIIGQFAHRT